MKLIYLLFASISSLYNISSFSDWTVPTKNDVKILINKFSGERWSLSRNKFYPLTQKQFSDYKGFTNSWKFSHNTYVYDKNQSLPTSWDWRKHGIVGPVKDQQQCGSCWAFSAIGVLESQIMKKTKKFVSLSEQEMVDCVKNIMSPDGSIICCDGCMGGEMYSVYQYLIHNTSGVDDTELQYPYTAMHGICSKKRSNISVKVKDFVSLPKGDEKAMMSALYNIGPLSIGVDANNDWQLYSKGIYDPTNITCDPNFLDHGVVLVGYGTENGLDYWIITRFTFKMSHILKNIYTYKYRIMKIVNMYKHIFLFSICYLIFIQNRHKIFHELIYHKVNIQNTLQSNDKCAIIGGGIGGLASAYYLSISGFKNISLYEKNNSVSGNIKNYTTGCPMMMSCFDLPRSKYIHNLATELGLKCTKCNISNLTLKSRNKTFVKPLGKFQGLFEPVMLFKTIQAFTSINYFHNKSDFKLTQLLCYLRYHLYCDYYSIENGNNYKLIEKLEYNIKDNVKIKTGMPVEKIKYIHNVFQIIFKDKSFELYEKLIISIPIHYLVNIIDKETTNNELLLIRNISKCFYGQPAFTCLHIDTSYCADNSSLTYTEVKYKSKKYYILTINPRIFYENENISRDKRITIWFDNVKIFQIDENKILDKHKSTISLLKSDKTKYFMDLSKHIKNNKRIYIASSYLSFTRWADDAIKMAYKFRKN